MAIPWGKIVTLGITNIPSIIRAVKNRDRPTQTPQPGTDIAQAQRKAMKFILATVTEMNFKKSSYEYRDDIIEMLEHRILQAENGVIIG